MSKGPFKYKMLVILLVTSVIAFISLLVLSWFYISRPNEFGDTAGWINGLFSALAFAGVIYAIFMQRDELELQREELRAQREESKIQNATLRLQRFENTFFNMMQLQQQITDNITFSYRYNVQNENWKNNPNVSRYRENTEEKKVERLLELLLKAYVTILLLIVDIEV